MTKLTSIVITRRKDILIRHISSDFSAKYDSSDNTIDTDDFTEDDAVCFIHL